MRDLPIVLQKEGFAVCQEIRGEQHIVAIQDTMDHFDEWKDGHRLIKRQKGVNIFVNNSCPSTFPKTPSSRPDRLEGHRHQSQNRQEVVQP